MLGVLIHGTLASDSSEKGEENKKVYQNLIRKLKVKKLMFKVYIYHINLRVHHCQLIVYSIF
jgi:hypothetical protein